VSPRYARGRVERRDDAAAGLVSAALGIGVGLVAFYVLRLMLSREPLEDDPAGTPSVRRLRE
jgi:hypothetical protein